MWVRASSLAKGTRDSGAYSVPANLTVSLLWLVEMSHELIGVFFDRVKGNCSFILRVDVEEEQLDSVPSTPSSERFFDAQEWPEGAAPEDSDDTGNDAVPPMA